MADSTPLQRAILALEADGWHAAIVRRRVGTLRSRSRLHGFIDLLAVRPDVTLAVHLSDAGFLNEATAAPLLLALPQVVTWLACPSRRLEAWAFRKRRGAGGCCAGRSS